ncbi:MAG: hypothetical protein HS117_11335 [Verrucomicrobiaceae bacterium]|nr:hypothetical protein [Verrucomicrobiaceae bacterium]
MKLFESSLDRARLLERPSWLVTCSLLQRESFGTVTSDARYEIAADTEDDARDAVRSFVRQSRPRCLIHSMQVARQAGKLA